MEPPKDAERIAGDVCSKLEIDRDRLRDQVRERFVRARGSESWIAGAVIHHHAIQLAWDVLGEHGLLTDLGDRV